jgi:glucose-1-phosphate adenylyltransferase
MNDVLTIILGGGRGTRLFPLTHLRSKPAVPIGGKYRLIDIPISNCLHAGFKRIYVLTQFNSASLNRHISQTYRLDLFSGGFVEVIAAEQTPEGEQWFQGTADAVRQAARHFGNQDAEYYLILAGDHIFRMDFAELVASHIDRGADITIAAQPVNTDDATQMGIFRFDGGGKISGFEEKPSFERLAEMGSSVPAGPLSRRMTADKPFMASMGIYVFSRDVLHEVLARDRAVDFGREIIPHALSTHRVHAHFYDGYWADVGTVSSFYDVNLMLTQHGAPFNCSSDTSDLHAATISAGHADHKSEIDQALVSEVAHRQQLSDHQLSGRHSHRHSRERAHRSVLLGAQNARELRRHCDGHRQRTPARSGHRRQERPIGDDVTLVNERNIQHADGDGAHPQRHHHRAEERRRQTRHRCLISEFAT